MLQTMGWLALALFAVLFVTTGAVMLLSPRAYFRLAASASIVDEPVGAAGEQHRTRIRGAMLITVTVWVAYHVFLRHIP
jgi:hypothetical protein